MEKTYTLPNSLKEYTENEIVHMMNGFTKESYLAFYFPERVLKIIYDKYGIDIVLLIEANEKIKKQKKHIDMKMGDYIFVEHYEIVRNRIKNKYINQLTEEGVDFKDNTLTSVKEATEKYNDEVDAYFQTRYVEAVYKIFDPYIADMKK